MSSYEQWDESNVKFLSKAAIKWLNVKEWDYNGVSWYDHAIYTICTTNHQLVFEHIIITIT